MAVSNIPPRFQGDDDNFKATITEHGKSIDITGLTVKMFVKLTDSLEEMSGSITDAVTGKVEFEPTANILTAIGLFTYEVIVYNGQDGVVYDQDILEIKDSIAV